MHLRLLKKSLSHEEVFLERYSSMLTWARNLTKNDAELPEDLVQEAYIQFVLTAPALNEIKNLDGYLYGLLRNLSLSHFRRETRTRLEQLSIYEFDSAEDSLITIDLRDQENARDELQRICSFLTIRKKSARTAGVFILRFFHGYFPSEIARILRTSRPAVDVRLMTARKEIRAFLDNPKDVKFIGFDESLKQIFQFLPVQTAIKQDEFLNQMRAVIFNFREGEHQSREQLRGFYENEQASSIDVGWLSHLVSCPKCLDEVNLMLNLPKLGSRFPTDAIGRDKKKDKDSDNDQSGGTGGGSGFEKLRRRVQRVFEHKPGELRILVNGVLQGSLKANAELNELKLNLSNTEPIGFIEIFSEQQVRLLILNVEELPPVGASNQTVSLALSDGRKLDLQLDFVAQGAELQLLYHDPTYNQVLAMAADPALLENEMQPPIITAFPANSPPKISLWSRWLETHRGFNLSPKVVLASLAILLIAALLFFQLPTRTVSAAELLKRAEAAEFATNKVVRRTIVARAKPVDPAQEAFVRKYEVWVDPFRKVKLQRIYLEDGKLLSIAKFSDNHISIYAPKTNVPTPPVIPAVPGKLIKIMSAWESGLTVQDFKNLIGDASKAKVEEQPNLYVINYSENEGAMKAVLVLDKETLRPLKLNFEYKFDGNISSFEFTESEFEAFEPNEVNYNAFEIDADFIEVKSKAVK